MDLKILIYETFKNGTEEEALKFLREKVLFNCKNNEERWDMLINKKYKEWSEKLLLFKENTYIYGAGKCFNYDFVICKFKFCEKEIKDLKEYLYCIFCTTYIVSLDEEDLNEIIKKSSEDLPEVISEVTGYSSKEENLPALMGYASVSLGIISCYKEITKVIEMSKNEFLEDINKFYDISYNYYKRVEEVCSEYSEAMKINYPKVKNDLQHLQQNLKECQIIKIYTNSDCTYIIKDIDNFYIIAISEVI